MKVLPDQNLAILPTTETDPLWLDFCYRMTCDPFDNEPSDFSLQAIVEIRLIVTEFIRQKWDRRIKINGVSRKEKAGISMHGTLLKNLLNLISEVFLLDPGQYQHPALWFEDVLYEAEAVLFLGSDENATKTKKIAALKRQNSMLTDLENPFEQPATRLLFDSAIRHANAKPNFLGDTYRPFLRSRKALTTILRESGTVFVRKTNGSSQKSRQGRKRIKEEPH